MAARKTKFPQHEPFGMRRVDTNRPASYHRGHLDTDWQQELLLPWQPSDAVYFRKVERGDRFRFMFDATTNTSHVLQVIDRDWNPVLTITQSASAAIIGNTTADGSQFLSYLYRLSDFSAIATNGIYMLLLTVNYDVTHTDRFVSHPFLLQDTHEGTIAIEYTNTTNEQGSWFEQLPCRYMKRVPGYIGALIPKTVRTVYQDQEENIDQLWAKSYRNYPLCIGNTEEGISDEELDRLTRIFDLDTVFLDRKQYRRADSADWSKQGGDGAALFGATLNIQEADNTEGFTYGDDTLDLYTSPLATPYALYSLMIGISSPSISLVPSVASGIVATVVHNSGEETTLISNLNSGTSAQELFGSFSNAGGVVAYQNGAGENYASASSTIYTTYFGFQFQCSGAPNNVRVITLTGATCIVEWGDGTYDRVGYSTLPIVLTKTFPNAIATYNIKIWGSVTEFSMVAQGNMGIFTGSLPSGMKKFTMDTFTWALSNTFDFSQVAGAQSTLTSLKLLNCGLSAANGFNSHYIPNLSVIDFSGNQLNSTVVSNFMYDVWRNATNNGFGPYLTGGTFSIVNQSPAATLNSFGNSYKSLLTTNNVPPLNWKVNN
jgi:hypothetical protein